MSIGAMDARLRAAKMIYCLSILLSALAQPKLALTGTAAEQEVTEACDLFAVRGPPTLLEKPGQAAARTVKLAKRS